MQNNAKWTQQGDVLCLPVMVTDKIYPLLIQMACLLPVMVTDKIYPLLKQKAITKLEW